MNTKLRAYGMKPVVWLKPNPDNPRSHPTKQTKRVAKSIQTFGFQVPILAASDGTIIAGHARWEAAVKLKLAEVPVLVAEDLGLAKMRAYMIADNRLAELSEWDEQSLKTNFDWLMGQDLDFDIEATGFDYPEIEFKLGSQETKAATLDEEKADWINGQIEARARPGDLWGLGGHRIFCGDAWMAPSWAATLEKRKIDLLFTDPPYNLPSRTIGKACADKHGDFQQASGEMSEKEFRAFLERFCLLAKIRTAAGAIAFVCIDWRHVHMMIAAGLVHFPEFKNLCVWNKSSAGMGSFYRNQHELILVFKMSEGAHQNNIQLGKYGRNRSNVWDYPSVQSFEPKEGDMEKPLDFHGTQKPVRMIEDAILDVTRKGDLVFDPFLGAGSTLIACEKAERVCCGVEIEPKYMDVILHRWEQWTGQTARLLVRAGEQADDE